jgi:molybdopterin converting factor subunit 1
VVVKVLFFGILKELTGLTEDMPEVPAGTTISTLFKHYARRFETLETAHPSILFACNREFVRGETVLSEDDEVAFLPPVSGGCTRAGFNG